MKNKAIYVVLGMHRSGTSMVAQMLQTVGINLGSQLIGPADDNQKGFWEDADIVALNERIFSELGIQWDSLHGFFCGEDDFTTSAIDALKNDAVALLTGKLSDESAFGFKDPRVSRLLPFWQSVFDHLGLEVHYVFTFRHPSDVQASLEKRNGFSNTKSAWLWALYNLDALLCLGQQTRWVELHYESVLEHPALGIQKLCTAFNIDMASIDPIKVSHFCDEFVDPTLRHHSHSETPTNDVVANLFEQLKRLNNEQLTRDEFQRSITSMSEDFQSNSAILDLVEYASVVEQAANQEIKELESDQATQFDNYHREESRLINAIDELKQANDAQFTQMKEQEVRASRAMADLHAQNAQRVEAFSQQEQQLVTTIEELKAALAAQNAQIRAENAQQNDENDQQEQRLNATIEQHQAMISEQKLTIAKLKDQEKASVTLLEQSQSETHDLRAQLEHSQSQLAKLNTRFEESKSTMRAMGEQQRETNEFLMEAQRNGAGLQAKVLELETQHKEWQENNQRLARNAEQSHSRLEAAQRDFDAKQAMLKAEFELEKKRLWDIVEKYRLISEADQLLTARLKKNTRLGVARLLRIKNGGDKSLFFLFKHRLKLILKRVVYCLPEDSPLRHHIMQFLIRSRSILRGEVDGKSLRKSHEQIIRNRQSEPVIIKDVTVADLPSIDVSVVSHNSARFIDGFIGSLLGQQYPLDKISLVVVDNASTDNTVRVWESHQAALIAQLGGFKLLKNDNVGFGEGHNVAFRHTVCDYVLVSNLDLEFTPDTIINAVTYAVNDVASVASWECRQQPFEHPKFYDPVSLDTSWSSHACILIKRACFDQVGGYEKRIFMYGEDVELSYRFRANGLRIKYLPKSVVFHYTYEEAAQVKPLQFAGSTLANAYLRLRYGSMRDVMSIPKMYASLLSADVGIPDVRRVVFKNIRTLLFNTPYFLRTRQRKHAGFSFCHWDYEMIRDGAFYEAPNADCCVQSAKAPLVSVITRTYQGREYLLKEALMSIVNQTHQAVEIVIVEDGGDTMRPLIDQFQHAHPHVSFVYQPLPKRGRCYAGNQGLSLASGDYLMFLDDDDLLFGDHIEVSLCELQNDSSLSAVYALSWDVETQLKGDSINEGYVEMTHSTSDVLRQAYDREVLQHHNYISIQSIVFKRALYERHGGFDEELDNLEDWNLWVRFSSNATFKLIAKTTSMFRTPWSVTEKAQRQKALDGYYSQAVKKNQRFVLSQRENSDESDA